MDRAGQGRQAARGSLACCGKGACHCGNAHSPGKKPEELDVSAQLQRWDRREAAALGSQGQGGTARDEWCDGRIQALLEEQVWK